MKSPPRYPILEKLKQVTIIILKPSISRSTRTSNLTQTAKYS